MLRRLTASKPSFEPIDFQAGFNVVIAERAVDAAETDSRNARGKTTMFFVINYMLGGSLAPSLRSLADEEWAFTLTLDMFGSQVTVTREVASGNRLKITYPSELDATITPYVIEGSISNDDWKDLLGLALFHLDPGLDGGSKGLSARQLLSYVVRTEVGRDVLKTFQQQPAWSTRQHIAFLLDLDWAVVRRLFKLEGDFNRLTAVQQAAEEGLVPSLEGEAALILRRQEVQRELTALQERVSSFLVLPSPESQVARADDLTQQISALRDEAVVDRRMEGLYQEALGENAAQDIDSREVAALYEQLGRTFAEAATRRLDEVQAFHQQLMANRRSYLIAEVDAIRVRTSERDQQLRRLHAERAAVMDTLSAGGALEELVALQSQANAAREALAAIDQSLQQNRDVAARLEQIRLERATERAAAAKQLATSRGKLDRVSEKFNSKFQRLYGQPGVLSVSVDDWGYKVAISVAGQSSTGVRAMQLLCLDLTLLEEGVTSGHHPDFLAHDSVVYDGVDPRQTAAALRLVQETVSTTGGQYICAMNSNDVPEDVSQEKWFEAGIIRTVLDTDVGGLLGAEF